MTEIYDLAQLRGEMTEWVRQLSVARTQINDLLAEVHKLTETVTFREFQLANANEIIDSLAARCQQLELELHHAKKRNARNLETIRRHETGEL